MKAEYVTHMGDDLLVVNAARVSFNKHKDQFDLDDRGLLNYLAKHGHWTPFSHPQICMREKVPIFVARQRFKHMVGFTYNEVSRRYVDDTPEFYTPESWRSRPAGSVKQGSGESLAHGQQAWQDAYDDQMAQAESLYETMIKAKIAPEQARSVLPQSMYTEYYVTGSLSAWARAYQLRIDKHSQKEIQDLAVQWGEILAPLYPNSWEVLTNGE